MMKNISASEGEKIFLKYKYLEKGSYVKIQPQTNDCFEISNTKAILESKLRNFTCLTKTDLIAIEYNEKIYWLNIIEVKPGNAISIVETDINLDFISPSLYNERNQNSLKNKSNLIINEKKKKEKNSTTMDFDKFSSESI
jgi:ubiquitin fusion degradation protein 1